MVSTSVVPPVLLFVKQDTFFKGKKPVFTQEREGEKGRVREENF